MLKKLTVFLVIIKLCNLDAQDLSIFFLKDGSIVQGKVVNENQHRLFLKTDQGTIKILPSDILGREDAAKKGDLTFISERLEYLQGNVNHLSGQVNHWNDSLKNALFDLHELFKNLEVLQNEFEIDLLRLHSQGREQKKKIEYVEDDLVTQRVEIASNRQEMGGIDDTVSTLNQQFSKARQKLDITANQSYLLSGNLSTIKKDIQSLKNHQDNQQNQIDMMAGALANNIQEVIRVQSKFANVENGVSENKSLINKNSNDLIDKTDKIRQDFEKLFNDFNRRIDIIVSDIDKLNKSSIKARKNLTSDIQDIVNELGIVSDKINTVSRDLSTADEKIEDVDTFIKKIEKKLTKLKDQVDAIPVE